MVLLVCFTGVLARAVGQQTGSIGSTDRLGRCVDRSGGSTGDCFLTDAVVICEEVLLVLQVVPDGYLQRADCCLLKMFLSQQNR